MAAAYLHALATTTPAHRYAQTALGEAHAAWLEAPPRLARSIRQLYEATAIEQRHAVLPGLDDVAASPYLRAPAGGDGAAGPAPLGTDARMALYREHAGGLFIGAARAALLAAGVEAAAVTHLITASCTGFACPGADLAIVAALGLDGGVARQHLGFMGCYAAIPALRLADQIARAEPDATVLLVCAELCSLHLQFDRRADSLRAGALFADGAAAGVVRATPPERGGWRLDGFGSALDPSGAAHMTWDIGDSGFRMTLDSRVPLHVRDQAGPAIAGFLARRPTHRGGIGGVANWAVHPGGVAILDAVATGVGLAPDALAAARAVLRTHGNMSSPTVLFVLHALASRPGPTLALAFGPGLTLELALLERLPG